MKRILALSIVLLVGCDTVPVVLEKFPEAPKELLAKCEQLKAANDNVKLSELAKNITDNYKLFHLCSNKNDGWVEWYNKQRKIFNEAHK